MYYYSLYYYIYSKFLKFQNYNENKLVNNFLGALDL